MVLERSGEQVFIDAGEQLWVAILTPRGKRRWWMSAVLGGVEGGAGEVVIGTQRGKWAPLPIEQLLAVGPELGDRSSRRQVRRWLRDPEKHQQPEEVLLLMGQDAWRLVFHALD